MTEHDDYSVPKPSKIKLKETKADRYERHYRREQRRLRKETRKVYKANGLPPPKWTPSPPRTLASRFDPISPPRGREESITPPRIIPSKRSATGSAGASKREQEYKDEIAQDEFAERLRWMEAEQLRAYEPSHAVGLAASDDGHGRGGYLHIPRHVRQAAGSSTPEPSSSKGRPPDHLDEEAYAEYIREGMYRRANAEELARQAAAQAVREAAARKAALKRAKAEEEEAERMAELHKEQKKRDRAMKREREEQEERARVVDWRKEINEYERRWTALRDGLKVVSTGVALPQLGFADFPWPVYRPRSGGRVMLADLNADSIRHFLFSLVKAAPSGSSAKDAIDVDAKEKDKKRVLRDAILAFHPDRFLSRFLDRARDDHKEDVKEAVGICSRIINDLASEGK